LSPAGDNDTLFRMLDFAKSSPLIGRPMDSQLLLISPTQLRQAADIKEKMEALQNELDVLLGATSRPGPEPAAPKKRRMSAAGRARIAAATRARWAGIKGAKTAVSATRHKKRTVSAAMKARLRALAKDRWAKVRAAGKNAL
jgi:hypothetical protein